MSELKNQHGDVLLKKAEFDPEDKSFKRVSPHNGRYVLKDGEVTGHAHVLPDIPEVMLFEKDGRIYCDVKEQVTVTHEEHEVQVVEPGQYMVDDVVEQDPFEDVTRKVLD